MSEFTLSVDLRAELDAFEAAMRKAHRTVQTATDGMDRATKRAAQRFDRLEAALDPAARALRRIERDMADVNRAVQAGAVSADRGGAVAAKLNQQYRDRIDALNGIETAAQKAARANREMAESARAIDRLEAALDPSVRLSQQLAEGLGEVDRALARGAITEQRAAKIRADLNRQHEAGVATLDRMSSAAHRAAQANMAMGATGDWTGVVLQQAGFQIGDFATQVAMGGNAMLAFVVQGSQLLGMFGTWGAVMGAGTAVLGAVATGFVRARAEAGATGDALSRAGAAAERYRGVLNRLGDDMDSIVESSGSLNRINAQFEAIRLIATLREQRAAVIELREAIIELLPDIDALESVQHLARPDWLLDEAEHAIREYVRGLREIIDAFRAGDMGAAHMVVAVETLEAAIRDVDGASHAVSETIGEFLTPAFRENLTALIEAEEQSAFLSRAMKVVEAALDRGAGGADRGTAALTRMSDAARELNRRFGDLRDGLALDLGNLDRLEVALDLGLEAYDAEALRQRARAAFEEAYDQVWGDGAAERALVYGDAEPLALYDQFIERMEREAALAGELAERRRTAADAQDDQRSAVEAAAAALSRQTAVTTRLVGMIEDGTIAADDAAEMQRLLNAAAEDGVALSEAQVRAYADMIDAGQDAAQALDRINQAVATQNQQLVTAQTLIERYTPGAALTGDIAALNAALAGFDTEELRAARRALDDIEFQQRQQVLMAGDFGDGWEAAFERYQRAASDSAAQGAAAFEAFQRGVEHNLSGMIREFDFSFARIRDIALDALADIAAREATQGLLNLLGRAGGSGGFLDGVFDFFGGWFAAGGRPPVGLPSIVGERGPELFVPDRPGLIVPNHHLADWLGAQGRFGDAMVAHISPAEGRLLARLGGSGTINPVTGLPEYFEVRDARGDDIDYDTGPNRDRFDNGNDRDERAEAPILVIPPAYQDPTGFAPHLNPEMGSNIGRWDQLAAIDAVYGGGLQSRIARAAEAALGLHRELALTPGGRFGVQRTWDPAGAVGTVLGIPGLGLLSNAAGRPLALDLGDAVPGLDFARDVRAAADRLRDDPDTEDTARALDELADAIEDSGGAAGQTTQAFLATVGRWSEALAEVNPWLTDVEQASARARQEIASLSDGLARIEQEARRAGEAEEAAVAVDALLTTLAGANRFVEPASEVTLALAEMEAGFAAMAEKLADRGLDPTLAETGFERSLDALQERFEAGLRQAVVGPTIAGWEALARAGDQRLADARALGADLVLVERSIARERQEYLEQLSDSQRDMLEDLLDAVSGVTVEILDLSDEAVREIDRQITTVRDGWREAERAADAYRGAAGDLRASLVDLRSGDLTILPARLVLDDRSQRFDRLLASSSRGDVDAMRNLSDAAAEYLETARTLHASTPAYVDIFERVQAGLGSVAATAGLAATAEDRTVDLLQVNNDLLEALRDEMALALDERDQRYLDELQAGFAAMTAELESLPALINIHLDLTGRIRDIYEPALLQQIDPAERIITEAVRTLESQGLAFTAADARWVPFTETLSRLADVGLDFTAVPDAAQVTFVETLDTLADRGLDFTAVPLPQVAEYIESLITLAAQRAMWSPVAADAVRTLREELISLSDQAEIWSTPAADHIRRLRERLTSLEDRGEHWTPVAQDAVRRLTEDLLSLAEQDQRWSVPAPDALRTLREYLVSMTDQGEAWSPVAADATRTLIERFRTVGGTLTEAQRAWLDLFNSDHAEQTRALTLLTTLDVDRSGALSLAEFLAGGGDRERFDALDLNADRQLDIIELLSDANMLSETGNAGQAILQRLTDQIGSVGQRTLDLLDRSTASARDFQTRFLTQQESIIGVLREIAQMTEQDLANARARERFELEMAEWQAGLDTARQAAGDLGRSAAATVAGLEGFWGQFKIPGAWISHVDWGGTDTAHAGHNRNNAAELERLRSFTESTQAVFRSIEEMTGGVISPNGWIGLQPGWTRFNIWGQESRAFEGTNLRPVFEALVEAGLAGIQQVDPEVRAILTNADFADAEAALRQIAEQIYLRNNLAPVPGFAGGGYHAGGVRLVGERGPELEITGPSRFWSHDRTRDLLAPTVTVDLAPMGNGVDRVADLLAAQTDRLAALLTAQTDRLAAEIRALRSEVRDLQRDRRHDRIRRHTGIDR